MVAVGRIEWWGFSLWLYRFPERVERRCADARDLDCGSWCYRSQRAYERFGGLHIGTADAARTECFWLSQQPARSGAWSDRTKTSGHRKSSRFCR